MSSLFRGATAAVCTATLVLGLAASARAAGIVYTDKGNVWVATPDGAVNRALTTDGTETTPGYEEAPQGELVGPYLFPSADDSGRVISARYRYGDSTANFFWKLINPDGSHIASNIVTMTNSCGSAPRPLGPFDARISADGGYVAFSFYCAGRSVGLNPTAGFVQDPPAWSGERVSWFGNQLIASRSGTAYAQQAEGAPLTDSWTPWVAGDEGETIGRVEVARGGGKLIFETTTGGTQSLIFVTFDGGVPSDNGAVKCKLATAAARTDAVDDPESFHATWSPDGTMIAWADSEGVKVAPAPDLSLPQNGEGQTCTLPAAPRLLSATGEHPSFTAYTWSNPAPAPPAGGGGTTTPSGGTTTTPLPAGKLAGSLPAKLKASALAKGVTLKLKVPGAGRLSATAKARGRTVASGRATAPAAGAAKVKLRLPAKARRRANRLRGKKLVLRVVFTPASGSPSTLQRTVRVR